MYCDLASRIPNFFAFDWQVMEPSAIIPLTLADSEKTKVVIAGDHKQMTEKVYINSWTLNLYGESNNAVNLESNLNSNYIYNA